MLARGRLLAIAMIMLMPPAAAEPSGGLADPALPWVTADASAPNVVHRTFESRTVGARVSYHAYIPPASGQTASRLPVLYWLHGTEGGIAGVRPVARFFDEAIAAGRIPAMIVVLVNGLPRRLWADSKDGSSPVETVFISEVIADVDRSFRTIASREGRILEGFSMGGYGAARLGFRHPSLFAGISILAGGPLDPEFLGPRAQRNPALRSQILREVCSNDMDYFVAISPWAIAQSAAPALREQGTVIRQVVGMADDTRELSRRFHERMTGLAIAHDYIELAGAGHDALALLRGLGERNGRFYRRALRMAEPERSGFHSGLAVRAQASQPGG